MKAYKKDMAQEIADAQQAMVDRELAKTRAMTDTGPTPMTVFFPGWKFITGQRVRKIKGSSWQGRVVGFYSTSLTPEGYAVESEREPGSVQIYPVSALEEVYD